MVAEHRIVRMENKENLTAQEAAEILNYHLNHVYRLLREGTLKGEKVFNRVWMVKRSDVEELKRKQGSNGRLPI